MKKFYYKCIICKSKATRSFYSKDNKMQQAKYCFEHAKELQKNGAFPKCKIGYIKN